jgi:chalcone synthase
MIRKRHMHITDELFEKNPEMRVFGGPSLDARQNILSSEIPKLWAVVAQKAIKD